MLDVARQTFLQSMEDIYQAADAMTEDNGYQVKVLGFFPVGLKLKKQLFIVVLLVVISAQNNVLQS